MEGEREVGREGGNHGCKKMMGKRGVWEVGREMKGKKAKLIFKKEREIEKPKILFLYTHTSVTHPHILSCTQRRRKKKKERDRDAIVLLEGHRLVQDAMEVGREGGREGM